ncbi:MAG: hypothetical protein ABIQ53_11915 [Terracoccus sp.]
MFGCSVDDTIRVPDGMTVAIDTGSGDLTRRGRLCAVETVSGDLDINVPADDTYAVDVRRGAGGENVTGKTDPTSPRRVRIETGSGNVEFGYR